MLPIEPVFAASMPSTWVSQAWASLPRAAARHVHGSGAQAPSFRGEHACSGLGRHLDSSAMPCTMPQFQPAAVWAKSQDGRLSEARSAVAWKVCFKHA